MKRFASILFLLGYPLLMLFFAFSVINLGLKFEGVCIKSFRKENKSHINCNFKISKFSGMKTENVNFLRRAECFGKSIGGGKATSISVLSFFNESLQKAFVVESTDWQQLCKISDEFNNFSGNPMQTQLSFTSDSRHINYLWGTFIIVVSGAIFILILIFTRKPQF